MAQTHEKIKVKGQLVQESENKRTASVVGK